MNRTIIRFHLRGIARNVKAIAKNILGLEEPIDLSQTTAAWHQPPNPSHPSMLCKCANEADGERTADLGINDHKPECEWRRLMCEPCEGTGYCPICMGDGTSTYHCTCPPGSGASHTDPNCPGARA